MPFRRRLFLLTLCVILSTAFSSAANAESTPVIHDRIAGMKAADGLFPTAWDAKTGKLFLRINKFDQDFLLVVSLPYGLGSNDIGLDRGRLGEERIVHFTRVGPRVLLVAPNLEYRSSSANPMEQLAMKQSFAESVLAGFKVEAEEDGAVLVDATDFLMGDSFGVAEQLADLKQGSYKLDKERCAFALENTKNFPLNTEFESILTFTTEHPAEHSLVATVTPDAHAVTLREHYSFVQLPDDGYKPRAFDPRSLSSTPATGIILLPLGSRLDVRLIERHRFIKKDLKRGHERSCKALSRTRRGPKEAPELIRTGLVEGVSWWNEALRRRGFKKRSRVEVLPPGETDPMDARDNVIEWVHRSTRGRSMGTTVSEPRTGEIIKVA